MKRIFLCLVLLFAIPTFACAMGPIYIGPKIATWDTVTGAAGYFIYWRTPGTTTWPLSQRAQTTATTMDLTAVGIAQGDWEITATVYDLVSESGPSNIVPWNFRIIGNTGNTKIQ